MIAAVAARSDQELGEALDALAGAGLVFRRGVPPRASFMFKHALVQDAAYGTLLRTQRQALHLRIGKVLEEQFLETAAIQPELLAHHYTQAALFEPAIEYWRKAGERALRRSANIEAVQHLTYGIELTRLLPASTKRARMEFELHLALGRMIRIVKGIAAPQTLEVFSRARDLLDETANVAEQMTVLYGLWGVHYVRAEHAAARGVAEECGKYAAFHTNRDAAALAKSLMGGTLWATGAFVEARHLLEQALLPEASSGGFKASPIVRENNEITATSFLAWTLWLLGYPEQATRTAEQALARARATRHVPLIAFVSFAQAFLATAFEADREMAGTKADDAIAYCFEHGITTFEHWARFCQGVIFTRQGDPQRAIQVMRAAMEDALQNHAKLFLPRHLGHLAIAHAALGEAEFGLGLLEEAKVFIETTGERLFEAEVYRLRGELLLRMQKPGDAEIMLGLALTVARTQHARMWELRAATNLAQLWSEGGRRAEARDLLAPLYGWFTEGFDTPELNEAKVLLAELG